VIEGAVRKSVPMFPELAVRELIANALIHQDFAISGTGPMLEIFEDRMEITNPGVPLGDIQRLLDQPPKSRNEKLAALMRRMGLCEERGSGIDKVVFETEARQLPPPQWIAKAQDARAIIFGPKAMRQMTKDDLMRACYQHACLLHERHETLTNTSLRERLGVEQKNSAIVSRIIGNAERAGLILPFDPDQGKRNSRYKPFWA
jgi:ATP-dependent DNA helicase RecG